VLRLLVTGTVVPSLPILVTLMMEAIRSSELPVLTGAALRHISEGGILHSHSRENHKSYKISPLSFLRKLFFFGIECILRCVEIRKEIK
jgi:hypothetical protein